MVRFCRQASWRECMTRWTVFRRCAYCYYISDFRVMSTLTCTWGTRERVLIRCNFEVWWLDLTFTCGKKWCVHLDGCIHSLMAFIRKCTTWSMPQWVINFKIMYSHTIGPISTRSDSLDALIRNLGWWSSNKYIPPQRCFLSRSLQCITRRDICSVQSITLDFMFAMTNILLAKSTCRQRWQYTLND